MTIKQKKREVITSDMISAMEEPDNRRPPTDRRMELIVLVDPLGDAPAKYRYKVLEVSKGAAHIHMQEPPELREYVDSYLVEDKPPRIYVYKRTEYKIANHTIFELEDFDD